VLFAQQDDIDDLRHLSMIRMKHLVQKIAQSRVGETSTNNHVLHSSPLLVDCPLVQGVHRQKPHDFIQLIANKREREADHCHHKHLARNRFG